MVLHGSVTEVVGASASDVFAVITDIDRLPEWNAIITRVVEQPVALGPAVQWVVELKAMGNSWRSRSRVVRYDEAARRFEYRTQTDDGNPSFAIWSWLVADDPKGAAITVTWQLSPRTFWRRVLLARIRNRALRGEVRASVRELDRCAAKGIDAR